MSDDLTELAESFQAAWTRSAKLWADAPHFSVDDNSVQQTHRQADELTQPAMTSLLRSTNARAVGWWRRCQDELWLLCFRAVSDMPAEVHAGFAQATRRVALTRCELGCVRAAVELRPVVAREDAARRGLEGSATWLEKFGASQSLAVPILAAGQACGVLAIATADPFDESSAEWRTVVELARTLSSQEP